MIEILNLSKTFSASDGEFEALRNVTLRIEDGDIFGVIGMSGAGKSTLVRCINMLERPTGGTIRIDGEDITAMKQAQLRQMRRQIGMIFQGFYLLQQKNCLKNVCFPLELAGVGHEASKKRALELLELVGLADKANAYPSQLSGGQQQRVAIARALATDPKILLCDEATSALDPTTTNSILELIRQINDRLGITVIMITHQMSVVEAVCNHVAILEHGEVAECGDVGEVFANPCSDAARRLVFPEGNDKNLLDDAQRNERFVRVVFRGSDATGKPLIAKMATELGVEANIANASTRRIRGRIYGSMLLSLPSDGDATGRAIAYLQKEPDVSAQEVIPYV